jgi:hypothetical protein
MLLPPAATKNLFLRRQEHTPRNISGRWPAHVNLLRMQHRRPAGNPHTWACRRTVPLAAPRDVASSLPVSEERDPHPPGHGYTAEPRVPRRPAHGPHPRPPTPRGRGRSRSRPALRGRSGTLGVWLPPSPRHHPYGGRGHAPRPPMSSPYVVAVVVVTNRPVPPGPRVGFDEPSRAPSWPGGLHCTIVPSRADFDGGLGQPRPAGVVDCCMPTGRRPPAARSRMATGPLPAYGCAPMSRPSAAMHATESTCTGAGS